jgi:alpha-glucosidase (family GH31 glycosyl hydrolase)
LSRRLVLGVAVALACAPPATAASISSGPMTAKVGEHPWHLAFKQRGGRTLDEAPAVGLAFHTPAGWMHATQVASMRHTGHGLITQVATTDPAGRRFEVRIEAAGDGAMFLRAKIAGDADESDVDAMRIGFASPSAERFFGFGQRSNAVDQRGHDVENYVSDGPWPADGYSEAAATIPPQGLRTRDDASSYPVPWLLSSRGYGVLIDRDEASTFHLATDPSNAWVAEVQSHAIALRIFGGPTLAQVLRRFTAATGRQPKPVQPWQYGPWLHAEDASVLEALQKADVPVSAAETGLRYLPCGLDRGNADEAARVKSLHAHGLAVLAYVDPMLCSSYEPLFDQASAAGALQKTPAAGPATFGFASEPVAQFDFTSDTGLDVFGGVLKRILGAGHDGWIEDSGEYTPPDATDAIGSAPTVIHNSYPTTYHCGVASILGGRRVVRLQRSGWTGAARCAQDVGGGDPTPAWGFDGLSSAVKQALGIGMSGVSRWGSEIPAQAPSELLSRWIEFGGVSGVMRTSESLPDPSLLAVWRRYAKLHTQLYPYLRAADAEYRDTGMPLMRALALTEPGAPATDDEFGFGPNLLAAPIVKQGQTSRSVRLPRGRWTAGLAYRASDGAWIARRAAALRGGRSITVRAGVDELPLLVRTGALLPLLDADVSSLYRASSFSKLRLLAFPRGRSQARLFDNEELRSRLTARDWTLTLSQARKRTVAIEAVLPWRACGPGVATRAGVTHRTVRMGSGKVRLHRCS